ncbi:MAG: heme exporter protein CcmD [Yoonia sp.]
MPDLGEYATEVMLAYGVSIVLLAALLVLSWRRYVRLKAALEEAEKHG